jgi:hypothetical protein
VALTYSVYRSVTGLRRPDLLSGATRKDAEEFAGRESAADAEGRAWVIERDDTWRWVAEYRNGKLSRKRG